jgi:serine/threonine protein kinase
MSAPPRQGTSLGRYQLIALLGKGGMGQVFRAYDTEANRMVALKVLSPQLARDGAFKERLRREANAVARLNNPHVVPIHHFGEVDGQVYLDMRLVDGRDLGTVLNDTGYGLDQRRAVAIVAQLASALHDAHRVGLVHRDVKPSNVLVTDRDFAYLIDFGLVRSAEDAALTATGFAMGTVSYMAPEQLTSAADARSDVYSLTCVLYECLTGRPPFTGDIRQKVAAHASTPPPQPSRVRTGVAAAFDGVIARGMAKDPRARYQSAPELAEAARAAAGQQPPRPQLPPRTVDPAWEPTQYVIPARFGTPAAVPPAAAQGMVFQPPRTPWWRRPRRGDRR